MWLWIVVVPVALVTLAFVVGSFLPERYSAEDTVEIELPITEVWERLHDPRRFPMSGKMCRGVEVLPSEDGLAVWDERMGGTTLRVRNLEVTENVHLRRELTDAVVPFRSDCEFWLEPTGTGTRVRCRNDVAIRSGTWHVPLFRISMTLFGGARAAIDGYLGGIAADRGSR